MSIASEELWEEALRLMHIVSEARGDLQSHGLDVIKLLASTEAASVNPRIRALIKGVEEKNSLYIKGGGGLSNGFGELLQAYRKESDFYIARWEVVVTRNERVDPEKIAHEELLDLLTRARHTMERTPEAIQVLVASAAILNYSQQLYYIDLLRALLQYPTKYRQTLTAAGDLAKAALMDLAGTAVPFLGTLTTAIDTVFDLVEPRIDKKIEELRQATVLYDRVYDFDDQLTELLEYVNYVQEHIYFADRALKDTHVSFDYDAAWISAVLGNAERK